MTLRCGDMVASQGNFKVGVIRKYFVRPSAYAIDVYDGCRLLSPDKERLDTFFSSRVI